MSDATAEAPFVVVLGVAQDGGHPQPGCDRDCCRGVTGGHHVACLGIVDPKAGQRWMIDVTPDFRAQLRLLDEVAPPRGSALLDGVLLTHAHMGHYSGLVFLGRESIDARGVPAWAMPRMRGFLAGNGPWDQLVELGNIVLRPLEADVPVQLNERVAVTPVLVPHRDEYSETVGFIVAGPRQPALHLPDVDKWDRWDRSIDNVLRTVDVAYLDGTFYADGELPGRDMSRVPHPVIVESLERFASLPRDTRAKVRFTHLNHTNPALDPASEASRAVSASGARIAVEGERFGL